MRPPTLVLIPAILLTLTCFAANSLLARLAMLGGSIDPALFTVIRLTSGAAILWLLTIQKQAGRRPGTWPMAFSLVSYAAAFSFAYVRLDTGAGALVLFGSVQITMILACLLRRERPTRAELLGLLVAFVGLLTLLLPGTGFSDPIGILLMVMAGASFGIYSLLGQRSTDPVQTTAGNFIRAVPIGALLLPFFLGDLHADTRGFLLACCSGAVASAFGYCLWYLVLPALPAVRAALLQLAVPILAACMGVMFLDEQITVQLIVSGALVLLGITVAIVGRHR